MSAAICRALAAWLALAVLAHGAVAHADEPRPAGATKPATSANRSADKPKADKQKKKTGAKPEEPEPQRVTDQTAYTLNGGSVRIGLFKIEYGIFDFLSVGTYTTPWSVLAPTITGKLRLLQADPVAIAVLAGFAFFDSSRLAWLERSPGDAIVTVFPIEALASFRVSEALTLSAGAAYTEVAINGTLSIDLFDGAGSGAADNFQLTGGVLLRFAPAVAVQVNARWLMLQRVSGTARATLHPDAYTTVVVNGNVGTNSLQVRDAFSVVPSLLLTFGVFNLRLGGGYGNFNVPLVNFVLPHRTPIPEFDLYFIF